MDQRHHYVHTVAVEPLSSRGTKGDPSFGASVNLKCRVKRGRFRFRDQGGDEVDGTVRVRFSQAELDDVGLSAVTTGARLTLPGGDVVQAREVFQADQFSGEPTIFEVVA